MRLQDSMYYDKKYFKKFKPHRRIWLTVALAKKLMKKNHPKNRTRSTYRLKKLVHDIEAGLWIYEGNPIRVDKNGVTIDGQYRCMAVIQTGIPIPVALEEGYEEGVFALLDSGGKPRTFGESLAMDDFKNTSVLRSALHEVAAFRVGFKQLGTDGDLKSDRKRLDSYIDEERQGDTRAFSRELALKEPGISECVDKICAQPDKDDNRKARLQKIMPLGLLSGFYYTYSLINKDLADTMIEGFSEHFTPAKRPFNKVKMYLVDLEQRSKTDLTLVKKSKWVKLMRVYALNVAFNAEMKGVPLNPKDLELKIGTKKGATVKDTFLEIFNIVGFEKYHEWLKANVKGF